MSREINRLLITGATGLIGKTLTRTLMLKGKQITVLSSYPEKVRQLFGAQIQTITSLDTLQNLNDYDSIINLAGEPLLGKRWSERQKIKIQESRWRLTERLSGLCLLSSPAPRVFISGSAIGFYGSRPRVIITEQTEARDDYLHRVCAGWEQCAIRSADVGTRICLLRAGLVLAKEGGILAKLLPLFKRGLGGKLGSGHQMMSWIHIDDMVAAIIYLLEHSELNGVFNLCAPEPVSNARLTKTLAKILHRPAFLDMPVFVVQLVLGEVARVITADQAVVPQRLMTSGFKFIYPEIEVALLELLQHKKIG